MAKKRDKIKKGNNNNKPPSLKNHLTFEQKASDKLTQVVGSWRFILILVVLIICWIFMNVYMIINKWDPYPFILLNFVLSCLAALQAPVILMSQNRQAERDRISAKYDYQVNRKAEREIQQVLRKLESIKKRIK
ncbi:DUF1003 domain-containing protein [Nanoarchaeota archaeon]